MQDTVQLLVFAIGFNKHGFQTFPCSPIVLSPGHPYGFRPAYVAENDRYLPLAQLREPHSQTVEIMLELEPTVLPNKTRTATLFVSAPIRRVVCTLYTVHSLIVRHTSSIEDNNRLFCYLFAQSSGVDTSGLPAERKWAVLRLHVSGQPCLHVSHDLLVLWLVKDLVQ